MEIIKTYIQILQENLNGKKIRILKEDGNYYEGIIASITHSKLYNNELRIEFESERGDNFIAKIIDDFVLLD